MRVLLVFSSSQLGGAERSLSRMALATADIDYRLATLDGEGPWCEWVRSKGHEPLVLGGSWGSTGAFLRLLRFLKRGAVDVIYVCGARAALVLRLLRLVTPEVRLVHGVRWNPDSNSRLDRFFRLMERFTYPLVDAWIVNSLVAKHTLVARCRIPAARIRVIYNGLELLPKDMAPLDERPMEVLTVANLNPRKGHREYLRVVREVLTVVPEARFVFVGRDDMNGEVQRAIQVAGLSDYVRFEGFQADVSPWYRRARLFVLPSLWGEGCPTSILEAFAHGVPVAAYAIDGVPELVSECQDGVLVRSGDRAGLSVAITDLLTRIEMSQRMGTAGRSKVEQYFTLARCAAQHSEVFTDLVGKNSE